jgi:hypothetical protein
MFYETGWREDLSIGQHSCSHGCLRRNLLDRWRWRRARAEERCLDVALI